MKDPETDRLLLHLQNRVAELEDENATLRLYFEDWCEGNSAKSRADFIGPPAPERREHANRP